MTIEIRQKVDLLYARNVPVGAFSVGQGYWSQNDRDSAVEHSGTVRTLTVHVGREMNSNFIAVENKIAFASQMKE